MFDPIIHPALEVNALHDEFCRKLDALSVVDKQRLRVCIVNHFRRVEIEGRVVVDYFTDYHRIYQDLVSSLWKLRRKNLNNIIKIQYENYHQSIAGILLNYL